MFEIIFDGMFSKNKIQYIRFKNSKTNEFIEIPLNDNIAKQILLSLQKIAPNQESFEAGNDEESI